MADARSPSSTRRELNERIRRSLSSRAFGPVLVQGRELTEWPFFCECGDESCRDRTSLPLDAFDAIVATGGVVLAEGHVLARAEAAQRQAAELGAEAVALQAEAQQARRHSRRLRERRNDPA